MRPVNLRAARRAQRRRTMAMRRPARRTPRALMTLAIAVLLAGASPWLRPAASDLAARMQIGLGLVVHEVSVEGSLRLPQSTILEALGVTPDTPILGIDLAATRNRIEDLAWVDEAVVRRRLPETLAVTIREHRPLALWLNEDGVALVSANSETVPIALDDVPAGLPLVTGPEAPAQAAEIYYILRAAEKLDRRVIRLDRVAGQRWRIMLEPALRIELPPGDTQRALARLLDHAETQSLLERAIAAVDLRSEDRVVVTPLPILQREETG